MAEKQKTKKQVAREYFSSMDISLPLRDRIDKLVEHMKIQFVNGQTERVVFNYIREDIPEELLPKSGGDLFKKILEYKISQKSEYTSPLWGGCLDENPGGKVIAILMIVDLYADKLAHHLDGESYSTNRFNFKLKESVIEFCDFQSENSEWVSVYCRGEDLIRNYFPFHSKDQLEFPVEKDYVLSISAEYLGHDGVEIFNHVMSGGRTYKDALNYLEDDYYWKLNNNSKNSDQEHNYSQNAAKTRSNRNLPVRFGLFIIIAMVIYFSLKPNGDTPQAAAPAAIDVAPAAAEGPSGYIAGSGASYRDSSSSIRNSMTSETKEEYDNMSSEGKAYVDDQMKKYDEHCSHSSDC